MSFVVAVMIFAVGATASLFEGIQRLRHPEPVRSVVASLVVIAIAAVFEGISWRNARRHLRTQKLDTTLIGAVRKSKDPSVFTVFLEDSSALVGLAFAAAGVIAAYATDCVIAKGLGSSWMPNKHALGRFAASRWLTAMVSFGIACGHKKPRDCAG